MEKETALFYVVLLLFAGTGIVTILGLVQRVAIEKKYLNALFFALLLELIAAVLYLFSSTDFFEDASPSLDLVVNRADLSELYRDASGTQFVELLRQGDEAREKLGEVENEIGELRVALAEQTMAHDRVNLALTQKITEIEQLRLRHDQAVDIAERYLKLEKQFLVRMAKLNTLVSEWGTSINFKWKAEDKREIARMLQEAFQQIGFMPDGEEPDDEPEKAHQLLVAYQQKKNFGESGFLTSEVIAYIIRDYLSTMPIGNPDNNQR